jgi:hypothetical protein
MIIDVLAVLVSVGVVSGLGVVLYAWFTLSMRQFRRVAARDVLTQWHAQRAELPEFEREHPPVEVLEAMLAAPSRRPRRAQFA